MSQLESRVPIQSWNHIAIIRRRASEGFVVGHLRRTIVSTSLVRRPSPLGGEQEKSDVTVTVTHLVH